MEREEIIRKITEKYVSPPEGEDERDEYFMRCALELAAAAAEEDEVPVGAVVVRDGVIVGADYNGRENKKDALYHAETAAVHRACGALHGWRLIGCDIYVTLEPCPMCAGAIVNARIPQVYFGAYDAKNGCCGSVANVLELEYGYHPSCEGGIMEEECAAIMSDFFKRLRK